MAIHRPSSAARLVKPAKPRVLRVEHSRRDITPARVDVQASGKDFNIGPVRLSFPYVAKPKHTDSGDRYSGSILLPPGTDVAPLIEAAETVIKENLSKGKKLGPQHKRGVRPAEELGHHKGYDEGWHFMSMTSKEPVSCVDYRREDIDPAAFYPGCWVRVRTRPFFYDYNGNVGAGWGFNGLQFLYNDTRLDSRVAAREAFDEWDDGETAGEPGSVEDASEDYDDEDGDNPFD